MIAQDPLTTRAAGDDEAIERAWGALLAAARWSRGSPGPGPGNTYGLGPADDLCAVPNDSPKGLMTWRPPHGWVVAASAPHTVSALLDLYLPICNARAQSPLTVGHLGQSLDGYIATSSGDSNYVTGPQNILHLHRMRALCDAVLVGADTVATDNPQLTARRADGSNPVRVILDPQRRLVPTHGVFSDGEAPTLLVCDATRVTDPAERMGEAEVLGVPLGEGGLELEILLHTLRARQLYAVFVEGGGKTVSAFLEQGLLDRLQLAVAPLVMGAGRPGIRLAARERMDECLRLSHRVFAMGDDVLFDCDLRAGEGEARYPAAQGLSRIA